MRQSMRIFILALFAQILTLSTATQAAQQNTHEYLLDNGLKLIVREDHRAPVVVSMVWYKVGGSYEPSGLTGISHALEHMMFKGTKQLGPGQFSRLMAQYGARENAFTSRDYTGYYQMFSKEYLPLSFAMEADRMHNLTLPKSEFDKELQVVIEERHLRTDNNPQALAYERFQALAFPASSYRNPVVGWQDDLDHMKVKDLRKWYEEWYTPNNATLVVAGDVSGPDVLKLAQKYFGPLPAKTLPVVKPLATVAEPGQREIVIHNSQATLPTLLMGFNAPVINTAKESWEPYALRMLAAILGGDESARLPRILVREQQLATDAGASYNAFARSNDQFFISAIPNVENGKNLQELQQALLEQIKKIQQQPPSAAELERVKAQLKARLVYGRDSIEQQAQEIGELESVGLSWRLMDQDLERISAVTPEQIQKVAQRYLIPARMTVAELVPAPKKNVSTEQAKAKTAPAEAIH